MKRHHHRGAHCCPPTLILVLALATLAVGQLDDLTTEQRDNAETAAPVPRPADQPFSVEVTGTGPAMILIPGIGSSGAVWKETVENFRDRYRCHVLTLAGFAGEPPIEPPLLPRFRDGLLEYISDRQLARPVIIGHSLGATVAYAVAASDPDAVGPIVAVDGVPFYSVLSDPDATPESVAGRADLRRRIIQRARPLRYTIQNRAYLSGLVTDPDDLRPILGQSNRSDQQTMGQAMFEFLTTDLRDEVPRITSPVLVICCTGALTSEEDRRQKVNGYRSQLIGIPEHTLLSNPHSRHFLQFDDPEFLYNAIDRFLGAQQGSREQIADSALLETP